MKMHENEGFMHIPSEETLDLGQKYLEDGVWSEWKRFRELKSLERSREIEQSEGWIALTLYIQTQ